MDGWRKKIVETSNQAKAVIYGTEKSMEEIYEKISEREKKKLEETLEKLKVALNSNSAQKIREYTDELLELVGGVTMKVKKVSQAKTLVSSVEKRLRDVVSCEERGKIREAVKRIEEAPYKDVRKEMNKLKEMITLIDADHGER
jgi:molecular chaperone DnaK